MPFQKGNNLWNNSFSIKNQFRKGNKPIAPFKKRHTVNVGKKHSLKTKGKISEGQKGFKHSNWKGGIKRGKGYIYIHQPDHPFAEKNRYVPHSHLVMEKMIGRYVIPPEIVHHKGTKYPINDIRNRSDDRPKNLMLFKNNSEHIKYHKNIWLCRT